MIELPKKRYANKIRIGRGATYHFSVRAFLLLRTVFVFWPINNQR
ncbi:hypothetical protein [Geomicrobium sp. JCM 19055]|nr:hypothetical protein [Geomicrobium sp. JCM 19055]